MGDFDIKFIPKLDILTEAEKGAIVLGRNWSWWILFEIRFTFRVKYETLFKRNWSPNTRIRYQSKLFAREEYTYLYELTRKLYESDQVYY